MIEPVIITRIGMTKIDMDDITNNEGNGITHLENNTTKTQQTVQMNPMEEITANIHYHQDRNDTIGLEMMMMTMTT